MSKQATEYLAQKADVLTGSSQSVVGAITVAKARNIAWFGTQWSQASLAPEAGRVVAGLRLDGHPAPRSSPASRPASSAARTYTITLKNGGEKIAVQPGLRAARHREGRGRRRSIAGIENGSIKVPQ